MAAACYQLAYVSRLIVALTEGDLQALCNECLRNNKKNGVTGLLAFDGSRFLQAIEGSERAVKSLMEKIVRDRRHDSIMVLSSKTVSAPEFGRWSMSFDRPSQEPGGRDFRARMMTEVAHVSDPALQAAFIGFARLTEQIERPEGPPGMRLRSARRPARSPSLRPSRDDG